MRKWARVANGIWVLIFCAVIISVIGEKSITLIRALIFAIALPPMILAVIVLGPNKHSLLRYALMANQIMAVIFALDIAWEVLSATDHGTGGLGAMMLITSVVNWISMIDNDRTKVRVVSGFGIWGVGFFMLAANNGAVSDRTVAALGAVSNSFATTMFLVMVVIGLLSLPTLLRLRKPKNDPISVANREGHLAFQNALDASANPYTNNNNLLAESWLKGYNKASKVKKR